MIFAQVELGSRSGLRTLHLDQLALLLNARQLTRWSSIGCQIIVYTSATVIATASFATARPRRW
jgi:hypothetical protein